MKTSLLPSLFLLSVTLSFAQGSRYLASDKLPNAAELAYFGGKHPDYGLYTATTIDTASVRLVKDFLNELIEGQFEAVHSRLAEGFIAYGPGFNDKLEADDLLRQSEQNQRLFTRQLLAIDMAMPATIAKGEHQGRWVYVKGVWSALDGRAQGKPIRIPFHVLAQVNNKQIVKTYTSYANDQLFYDLGFPIYDGRSVATQNR